MSLLDDNILENTDISSIGFPTKKDVFYKYLKTYPTITERKNGKNIEYIKKEFIIEWNNSSLFKNIITTDKNCTGIQISCYPSPDGNIKRKHGQVYILDLSLGYKLSDQIFYNEDNTVNFYKEFDNWHYIYGPYMFDKFFNSIEEAEENAFLILNRIKKNPAILNSKCYFQKNNNCKFYNKQNIIHFNKFLHEYTRR